MDSIIEKKPLRIDPKQAEEQYQLILPCDAKDFNQFVSSLLGKPQEESRSIDGCFHVQPKDISNIYHLINQRVTQQNEGSLAHLAIKVLYDNGTSITHNTVENFESYYPTSNTTPTEIVISFTYLIKFQNKQTPEKQEIEVVLSVDERRLHENNAWMAGGIFEYRILNTDRTWSADIANVLTNHSASFLDKNSVFWKWIRRNNDELFEYTFWTILFGFCSYWFFTTQSLFFTKDDGDFNYVAFSEHALTIIYLSIALIAFLKVIEKYATYSLYLRKRSYITLIDKDYDEMKKRQGKDFKKFVLFIGAWLVNVSSGIAASIIYSSTLP